ncbi:MAG: hypothetical protein ACOCZR_01805 [Halanaerobiales bacterium]
MKKIMVLLILILSFTCSIGIVVAEEEKEPLVSTVFFETDIREALNEVAMQTGCNIIYDETVVGTVTLDLEDVSLEKALEIMLIKGGYEYRKVDDNFYLVGDPDPESPMYDKLTESETIELDYITANQAVDLLPPNYERFIRTSDEADDLLTITAPSSVIENFKDGLAKIDNAEPEILIEVLATEVSTEVIKERGTDFFGLTTESDKEDYALDFDGVFALEAAGTSGKLMSRIKLLEEQGKAEITANPSIRVTNKETATLFVGEERVLILEIDDEKELEEVEIGVALKISPEIMAEDIIRMQIAPDVSHFTDERGDQIIVRRSELSSTIRGKHNETITMAGMTLDEVIEYETKVPALGDIPLLRWLFREEIQKKGEREMLIFITPKILGK